MKANPEFISREIAGELVLVPVGTAAKNCDGLITCNEVGTFIWKCLESDTSVAAVAKEICKEFEVDEVTAAKDAEEFIDRLKHLGAIKD